jgi:anti-sigma regulatory factor (Ser/Thr protein kinase)
VRELALHLLDVAQNSLEAGARNVEIEVKEETEEDRLTIKVVDDGKGMGPELLSKVLDPFVTTRTTRRMGLGLPLLAAAAERCDGHIAIESAFGRGTTVTATFRRSHIDRAPLGDVSSTLIAVMLWQPPVHLLYRHSVDDRAFVFDTEEVQRQLGEVPITHSEVIQWLRGSIKESIAELTLAS